MCQYDDAVLKITDLPFGRVNWPADERQNKSGHAFIRADISILSWHVLRKITVPMGYECSGAL